MAGLRDSVDEFRKSVPGTTALETHAECAWSEREVTKDRFVLKASPSISKETP